MMWTVLPIPIFLCSLKVTLTSASPQLIGHRGVIRPLPDGQIYRDRETVEAAEAASRFGLSIEYEEQIRHEQNRYESEWVDLCTSCFVQNIMQLFFRRYGGYPPRYRFYGEKRGRPLQQNEVFDFLDSRFIDVFPENEFNEFLDEVEVKRQDLFVKFSLNFLLISRLREQHHLREPSPEKVYLQVDIQDLPDLQTDLLTSADLLSSQTVPRTPLRAPSLTDLHQTFSS